MDKPAIALYIVPYNREEYVFVDYTNELAHVVRIDKDENLTHFDYNLNNTKHFEKFKSYLTFVWKFKFLKSHSKDDIYKIIQASLDSER